MNRGPGAGPFSWPNGDIRFPRKEDSTESFDALDVNEGTIFLASSGVKVAGRSSQGQCHVQDVNNDGLDDLVCNVETAEFMIEEGQDTAVLKGKTFDGTLIRGTDSIRIVPD